MFDYESILRTAWVEIDGTRLRDNIRAVQQRVGSSRIIGVAKANAYGHGAKEVAQAYMDCGVDMLAVATLAEAKELRDAGVDLDALPNLSCDECSQLTAKVIDQENGGIEAHGKERGGDPVLKLGGVADAPDAQTVSHV